MVKLLVKEGGGGGGQGEELRHCNMLPLHLGPTGKKDRKSILIY